MQDVGFHLLCALNCARISRIQFSPYSAMIVIACFGCLKINRLHIIVCAAAGQNRTAQNSLDKYC